jgi:Fic-DOC domain mobile mystery protein B
MNDELPPGATPLSPEDEEALLVAATTRAELDQFEAQNIADAIRWVESNTKFKRTLLTVSGLQRLHERMFDATWKWAGKFRSTDTNIGVNWPLVPVQSKNLCDDVKVWIENSTYPWPELAVRFHHRLVKVHPFPNGNGRHARLAANLLLSQNGQPPLPWGGRDTSIAEDRAAREEYLAALRLADQGNVERLLKFAVSDGR